MRETEIIVGGQAVIEGVMMRAPQSYAVAVRRPNGEIVSKQEYLPTSKVHPLFKLPVLRGSYVLIQSMLLGIKALNFSATMALDETEPTKVAEGTEVSSVKSAPSSIATLCTTLLTQATILATEALTFSTTPTAESSTNNSTEAKNSPSSGSTILMIFPALFFNILLFVFLPLVLTNLIFLLSQGHSFPHSNQTSWAYWLETIKIYAHPVRPSLAFNLVDGVIRMVFFLIFIFLMSRTKDIKRIFEYHGAEHKVVYNWESGKPLSVANARQQPRQHPRCGTSFLMIVMLVSIVIFSIIKFDSLLLNFFARVLLMPLVAGISYEFIRLSAKCVPTKDGTNRGIAATIFSLLTAPGLWLQNITTQEPADDQLEVAVYALEQALNLEQSYTAEPLAAD